ncbi:MAG: hypothetical protein GY816_06185, partial [Cytophagales bacterium]|nr:hypothetical protein [Cytophagales bacterium]
MSINRLENELPEAIIKWGWKYHHLGIPTNEVRPDERYIPQFKFYVSGFPDSPFGIEWMRFEEDCTLHPLIQTVPHLAFEVENLDFELANRSLKVLAEPNSPMEGVRVAMVVHNGVPVELMEF